MSLFRMFNELGTTVLIASHDIALIKRIADRVLVLNQGRLIDDVRRGEAVE